MVAQQHTEYTLGKRKRSDMEGVHKVVRDRFIREGEQPGY